jgi:hypothetical protein
VLSPTRTYAPVIKEVLDTVPRADIHGMVHCRCGGGGWVGGWVGVCLCVSARVRVRCAVCAGACRVRGVVWRGVAWRACGHARDALSRVIRSGGGQSKVGHFLAGGLRVVKDTLFPVRTAPVGTACLWLGSRQHRRIRG